MSRLVRVSRNEGLQASGPDVNDTYSQGFSWSSARYTIDVEFILGHLYTTSYCSRDLLGDRVGEFEEDMALELQRLRVDGASGTFVWSPGVSYIFARKRV